MERPENIWFLMSRNLSGEATPEEKAALMEALQQQPALMQQYELLQRLWKPDQAAGTEEVATRINHILQRSAQETIAVEEEQPPVPAASGTVRLLRLTRWAAAITGIVLAAWSWSAINNNKHKEENEFIAKKGSKTRMLLPDGSTVWLNAGSGITYDPGFSGNTREVTLQGEAYFDVVKMPDKPFIVHAGNINIRVLGTAFNVKSYTEEPNVETTLIHGLVQITRTTDKPGQAQAIYLHPNQKIVLPKNITIPASEENTVPQQPATVSTKDAGIITLDSNLKAEERFETAWMYNRLEFRGDRFDELARKLERWYNITIHFEEEQTRTLVFNGSLETETVQEAFRALSIAVPFQFEIKGNEVYIRSLK
jgi:transmembrane sensor